MHLFGREYLVNPPGLGEQCAESQREAGGGHEAAGLQGEHPTIIREKLFCTPAKSRYIKLTIRFVLK